MWRRRKRGQILGATAVTLAVACAGLSFAASAAFATNETAECTACAAVNGPHNNWVKNVESWNRSGSGLWDLLWVKIKGSTYGTLWEEEYKTARRVVDCWEFEVPEAHGETRRWYTKYTYTLFVRQTNYSKCEFVE